MQMQVIARTTTVTSFTAEAKGLPKGWTPNYHTTDNAGASISAAFRWAAGETSAGADYRYHHIYSNVLGDLLTHPHPGTGADAFIPTKKDGTFSTAG